MQLLQHSAEAGREVEKKTARNQPRNPAHMSEKIS